MFDPCCNFVVDLHPIFIVFVLIQLPWFHVTNTQTIHSVNAKSLYRKHCSFHHKNTEKLFCLYDAKANNFFTFFYSLSLNKNKSNENISKVSPWQYVCRVRSKDIEVENFLY